MCVYSTSDASKFSRGTGNFLVSPYNGFITCTILPQVRFGSGVVKFPSFVALYQLRNRLRYGVGIPDNPCSKQPLLFRVRGDLSKLSHGEGQQPKGNPTEPRCNGSNLARLSTLFKPSVVPHHGLPRPTKQSVVSHTTLSPSRARLFNGRFLCNSLKMLFLLRQKVKVNGVQRNPGVPGR